MKKIITILLALVLIACDNGDLTAPTNSIEKKIEIDNDKTTINRAYNSKQSNKLYLGLNQNIYPDPILISAHLNSESKNLPVNFYDDGGVAEESCDHIPHDGIFTAEIGEMVDDEYSLDIVATSGDISIEHSFNITFIEASAPIIEDDNILTSNYTFESGFDNLTTEIICTDPDNEAGMIDIQSLEMNFISSDIITKNFQFTRSEYNDKFVIPFDSTLAVGSNEQPFKISIHAIDSFGIESEPIIYSDVVLKNGDPVIIEHIVPDTQILVEGENIFYAYVNVDDPQSLEDINSVKFKFHVGSTWNELYDDGLTEVNGDEEAEDGIYTSGFKFNYPGITPDTYHYDIVVEDKAGNTITITDSITFTLN